nr:MULTISPECIES: DUF948 domain-containing protein [unclassified Paenibacillus]
MLCILAFLLFVFFAIRLVRTATAALKRSEMTLDFMQEQVRRTTEESERLLKVSTEVMQEVQEKMRMVDAWFTAANETGEAVNRMSRSVKAVSLAVEDTVGEARRAVLNHRETAKDLVELMSAGLHLWHRLQASKPNQSKE